MVSKTYQWAIVPDHASISDLHDVLLEVGFTHDGDQEFVVDVMDWKPLRAKVKKDEIIFSFHWAGSSVTSKYYDYLVHAGMLLEQVKFRLSRTPPKQLEAEDG